MEVIIGTYEEFLLGYKLETRNEKRVLVQSFADKSHSGAIKSLSVEGPWVATGSTDDRIFIYDMQTRKQSQILVLHNGTVNALAFTPERTHLLSGGADGVMIATRLKTWCTEATWNKAHNSHGVIHITCHPSGKLALSLGADLVLRTWNLVKGRVAYKTNLKSRNTLGPAPDCLSWSPSGDYFTISGQRLLEIWSIKSADVAQTIKTKSKPICLCWIHEEACLLGLEDGTILWITLHGKEGEATEIAAHGARVKAMAFHKGTLVTASSAGEVKLWEVLGTKKKLKEIVATNIGCRPTCLGILDLEQFGANYAVSKEPSDNEVKEVVATAGKRKAPPAQRGVVTIEYDGGEEEEEKEAEVDPSSNEDDNDVAEGSENANSKGSESSEDSSEDASDEESQPKNRRQTRQQNKAKQTKNVKPLKKPAAKDEKKLGKGAAAKVKQSRKAKRKRTE